MDPQACSQTVMILAGEASGDLHAARLARALLEARPDLNLFGYGGRRMRAAGVQTLVDCEDLSVVGLVEIAEKAGPLLFAKQYAAELLEAVQPDLLIILDFPDFNLMAAKAAKKRGVPVLYYITPQVWAWRKYRIRTIQKLVDRVAVILPFEKEFFEEHGVEVTFVGHPILDDEPPADVDDPLPGQGPLVGIVPGSRRREVATLLPVMLRAARAIAEKQPDARFVLPLAPALDPAMVSSMMDAETQAGGPLPEILVAPGQIHRVLAQASAVMAVSGTVTLEAALAGAPTVIIYRLSRLSYVVARILIHISHMGLANLIAKKTIQPELLQGQVTPQNIAEPIQSWLQDPELLADTRAELLKTRDRLGGPGASGRAAQVALDMLEK